MGIAQLGDYQLGGSSLGGVDIPDLQDRFTQVDENVTKTVTGKDTMKHFKVDDEKPEFSDTLQVDDGTSIDLTNAESVKIRYEDPDGNVSEDKTTITNASNGLVEYQFPANVIDQEGLWRYEYLVTFSDDTQVTVPNGNDYNSITVGDRL